MNIRQKKEHRLESSPLNMDPQKQSDTFQSFCLAYMRILHPHSVSMSACKRDVLEYSFLYTAQPPYLHYRHLDRTFKLGGAFGLRVRCVRGDYWYTYDIIACKKKNAKLKSANWNWRPIRQIKFPQNFPAIRYMRLPSPICPLFRGFTVCEAPLYVALIELYNLQYTLLVPCTHSSPRSL